MTKRVQLSTLNRRRSPLASPEAQLDTLHRVPLQTDFETALRASQLWPLRATGIQTLQLNLGKVCNQTCLHCHVDAGPDRVESMTKETMEECLRVLQKTEIPTVDITGGAPEMNPHFRWLVEQCRGLGRHVIDRCNLTILETGPHRDLPEFLAQHQVEVVCSLPHYRDLNTDKQRGQGVFEKSVRALRRLNALGYGDGESGLRLVLVANPVGAFMPPNQASLEAEWKREMWRRYEIRFDSLFTITNMPISRYLHWLEESDNLEGYLKRLVGAYNPSAARGVMCRDTLSVGWDGRLFDCDFNQMLDIPVKGGAQHIRDYHAPALEEREIAVDTHCFGCTAGSGSSCGGATV